MPSSSCCITLLALAALAGLPLLSGCDSPRSSRSGPARSTPSGTSSHPFYDSPDIDLIPVEEAMSMRGRGGASSGASASVGYEVAEPADATAGAYGLEEDWPEAGTAVELPGELEPRLPLESGGSAGTPEIAAQPVVDPAAGTYAPEPSYQPGIASTGEDSLSQLGPGAARLTPVACIEHPEIRENSGLAYLHGDYWTVNDSGDGPYVYRSSVPSFAGAQKLTVPGAEAVDWEDLAVIDGDLLICDVGDNLRQRNDPTLYRVRAAVSGLELVATYPIAYPDGPHDVEAAVVIGGVVHLIVKNRGEDGSPVFAFTDLVDASVLPVGERNMGQLVGNLSIGDREQVTAADISADGLTIAVMTYAELLLYPSDRLDGEPMGGFALHARQNEALAFAGETLVFTNEQRDVYQIEQVMWVAEYWWLPPRTSANLKRVPLTKEALQAKMPPMELLAEMPIKNAKSGEFLRFGVSDDQLFFDGRFYLEDSFFPSSATGGLGTAVIIVIGEEQNLRVGDGDFQLALTGTEEGKIRPRRVHLDGGSPRGGLGGLRYGGHANDSEFRFTLAVSVDEVFPDGLPDVFLLNVAGSGLRRPGVPEPLLSGLDAYSLFRPFMWGAIHAN